MHVCCIYKPKKKGVRHSPTFPYTDVSEAQNGHDGRWFFGFFVFVCLFCFCFCFCFCFFFCPSGFTMAPIFCLFIWKCCLDIGCLCHFTFGLRLDCYVVEFVLNVIDRRVKQILVGILVAFCLLVDLLTWSGGSRIFQWHISNFSFESPPPPDWCLSPNTIFKVNSFIHFILSFYMIMIHLLSGVHDAYVTYVCVHFTRGTIKRQFHPFTAKTGINQSACRPLLALLAKGITLVLIDIHRTGSREGRERIRPETYLASQSHVGKCSTFLCFLKFASVFLTFPQIFHIFFLDLYVYNYKLVTWMLGLIDPPFLTRFYPPLLFCFAHMSHLITPVLYNSQEIYNNLSLNALVFDNLRHLIKICIFYSKLLSKSCPNFYFAKIGQNCLLITVWSPFFNLFIYLFIYFIYIFNDLFTKWSHF